MLASEVNLLNLRDCPVVSVHIHLGELNLRVSLHSNMKMFMKVNAKYKIFLVRPMKGTFTWIAEAPNVVLQFIFYERNVVIKSYYSFKMSYLTAGMEE